MGYDDWKQASPTDDMPNATVYCAPGEHSWAIGKRTGERCIVCGISRGEYELRHKDTSRDSLRRYPCTR